MDKFIGKMLKYIEAQVVFREIPDEITLAINITGCPNHCSGCHSKYLWKDVGNPLDLQHLTDLIDSNKGITCVCIMGGDQSPDEVDYIAQDIKEYYPGMKVGWYSGRQELHEDIDPENFDFIKLGPYIEDRGPLNNPNTNQRLYQIVQSDEMRDITFKFWKNENMGNTADSDQSDKNMRL